MENFIFLHRHQHLHQLLVNSSTRGTTLVEVVIGIMLVAVIGLSLMSIALTSRRNTGRIDRKTAAAMAGKKILDNLKNYVTSDTSASTGPGIGAGGWTFPGDGCACYAFADGAHALDAASWLPALAGAPYNASVGYTVTSAVTVNGKQPTVALSIKWTEP